MAMIEPCQVITIQKKNLSPGNKSQDTEQDALFLPTEGTILTIDRPLLRNVQ